MNALPPDESRGPFAAWARRVTARPGVTLLIVAVLTVTALATAYRIEPATGVQDMLADDQPAALALVEVLDNYALVDDLIVLARLPAPGTIAESDLVSEGDPSSGGDPDRLIAFAQRLEAELADEDMVAGLRFRPSAQAAAFIEEFVIPHGRYYLDPPRREALDQRLTRQAMDEQFAQNAAMLAAPGPAAGRLAKELIRDPLRLRDFIADGATNLAAPGGASEFMEGVNAMVSVDGRAIMIRIAGRESANNLEFTAAFMQRIREAVDMANEPEASFSENERYSGGSGDVSGGLASGGSYGGGGLRIDYTGSYAIADLSASQTRSDMIRSCTGSIILLVVVFVVVYRHPMTFWLLTLPIYVAIVGAFGIYAAAAGRLTPVTAVAGAVLAGLGIDYCVHVLSHHEASKRARSDGDDRAAGVQTVAAVGPAVMAACVTSLIGFGAVLGASVQSLREFAFLGMLGLALALLASITVLPALLALIGPTRLAKRSLSATRFDVEPMVHHIARHPRRFLWLSAVTIAVAGFAVVLGSVDEEGWRWPVEFDRDLHALHPRPHPPLETQDTLAEVFGAAPNSLMILVEGQTPGQMLATAHEVQRRFADPESIPPGSAGVVGPATLLPSLTAAAGSLAPESSVNPGTANRSIASLAWSEAQVQTFLDDFRGSAEAAGFNAEAFSESAEFLEFFLTREPPTFADVRAYPDLAGAVLPKGEAEPTQGLVLVTLARPWTDVTDRDETILAVRNRLADLSEVIPGTGTGELPGATLTGITVVGYDTQQAIGGQLTRLLGIAAVLVLVWLLVFFRRPGDLVLALVPSAAGVLALVTGAELFGWTLNAINLIAMPLVVGIGVDDGIFLVAIARRCRRRGETRRAMVGQLAASAHAITMTSVTTGLAFGSLALTSVPAIRSLGWFTGLGVGAAWLASLALLLPVLVLLYPKKASEPKPAGPA